MYILCCDVEEQLKAIYFYFFFGESKEFFTFFNVCIALNHSPSSSSSPILRTIPRTQLLVKYYTIPLRNYAVK